MRTAIQTMQTSSEKRASIKMQAKGSIISEYVLTKRTNYWIMSDWKRIEKDLRSLQAYLKNIEARIRQANPEYKMRWSEIKGELIFHYLIYLHEKANRHKTRILEINTTINNITDFWDWMSKEYGNGQLNNAAKDGYQQYLIYNNQKRRTA